MSFLIIKVHWLFIMLNKNIIIIIFLLNSIILLIIWSVYLELKLIRTDMVDSIKVSGRLGQPIHSLPSLPFTRSPPAPASAAAGAAPLMAVEEVRLWLIPYIFMLSMLGYSYDWESWLDEWSCFWVFWAWRHRFFFREKWRIILHWCSE